MNIRQSRKPRGPIASFARFIAGMRRRRPISVEIQWPMADASKVFEIEKFEKPQIELLIWMMYGAGFDHDAITILLQNMGAAKMATPDAIADAVAGTEPIKDALSKAWSLSSSTPS